MRQILDLEWWDKLPTLAMLAELGFITCNRWDRYLDLEVVDFEADCSFNLYKVRREYASTISWCVPSRETLELIANTASAPLLELGAGTGFWTKLLRQVGADVVATNPHGDNYYPAKVGSIAAVEDLRGVEAQAKYPDRDLLVTWPGYGSTWMTDVAKAMRPNRKLYYIGEGDGGCCADDSFFETVEDETLFTHLGYHEIAKFDGINDHLAIYQRI